MDEKGFQKIDLTAQNDTITPTPMESATPRRKRKFTKLKNGSVAQLILALIAFAGFAYLEFEVHTVHWVLFYCLFWLV